jgi:hypothetical protein
MEYPLLLVALACAELCKDFFAIVVELDFTSNSTHFKINSHATYLSFSYLSPLRDCHYPNLDQHKYIKKQLIIFLFIMIVAKTDRVPSDESELRSPLPQ